MSKGVSRLIVELQRSVGQSAESYINVVESTNDADRSVFRSYLREDLRRVIEKAEEALTLVENPYDDDGNEVGI